MVDVCSVFPSLVTRTCSHIHIKAVLYRNNVRVRNVWNVRNVQNMFAPRLFGTFGQHWPQSEQNQPKSPKVDMLKSGMSVLILVSNGDIQRSNRICSQDYPEWVKINPKLKVNMLKSGDVNFDLGLRR